MRYSLGWEGGRRLVILHAVSISLTARRLMLGYDLGRLILYTLLFIFGEAAGVLG